MIDSGEQEERRMHDKHVEENTAHTNGSCKAGDCTGRVEKQVIGSFRGSFEYGTPTCNTCGRTYLYEQNAVPVGAEEFRIMMNMPMGR